MMATAAPSAAAVAARHHGAQSPRAVDGRRQQHRDEDRPQSKKLVNVTVTVLSVSGILVKDQRNKMKKGLFGGGGSNSSRGASAVADPADENATAASCASGATSSSAKEAGASAACTTIVASFSRAVKTREGKHKTVMTHVPSLPLPLQSNGGSHKKNKTLNSAIHWPEQQGRDEATAPATDARGRVLSSYQFQCTFAPSTSSQPGYVPQPLSIQVSISRSGRMFKLGTADILLSGEEDGTAAIDVPIMNCNPTVPKNGVGGSSKLKASPSSSVPMMKLKGDSMKCGLDPGARLKVLVHVSDPIGETLEISERYNVTMISSSNAALQSSSGFHGSSAQKQESNAEPRSYKLEYHVDGSALPSAVSWEYDPALEAVAAKTSSQGVDRPAAVDVVADSKADNHNARQVERPVREHQDYEDDDTADEPSCTSSAYMSEIDDRHQQKGRYPSKKKYNRDASTLDRSHGSSVTATTTSTMMSDNSGSSSSSDISDLTDGQSWLSQAGIEVIPRGKPGRSKSAAAVAAAAVAATTGKKKGAPRRGDISTASSFGRDSTMTSIPRYTGPLSTSSLVLEPPAPVKKKTWRQRLTCGLPVCGASCKDVADDNVEYDDAALSAIREDYDYEDDVMSGTNKYGLLAGRGCAMNLAHPSESYYTEGSFVDDDDDSSESSSVSYV